MALLQHAVLQQQHLVHQGCCTQATASKKTDRTPTKLKFKFTVCIEGSQGGIVGVHVQQRAW
jgi:hypothetical protein